MSDLRHVAQRMDSEVRILPFIDQVDLLVVLATGLISFVFAGRLFVSFGLRILFVASLVFIAFQITAALKRKLAPYPKVLSHALSWGMSPDTLEVGTDPSPVELYAGSPPLPK